MNRPRASVIIPTYNSGQFVGHAIESVLSQSVDDVELIVVDDGSVDGTAARVSGYQPKVRYVVRPHRGPGAARNYGAGLARGEWLAFLDADDFWYPHKLADQLGLADRHPTLDFITGNHHTVDETGRLMGEAFADNEMIKSQLGGVAPQDTVFAREAAGQYVEHRFGILSTTMVRAGLFGRVGGFSERYGLAEDIHLMFRLAAKGRSFGAVRRPVAAYRRRAASTSHRDDERRHCVTIDALTDLLRYHALPAPVARAVRDLVAETQLDLGLLLARGGRRMSATAAAGRAFLTKPSWRALRTAVSVGVATESRSGGTDFDWGDPVELFRFGAVV